jgi:hypothetical protein
MTAVLCETVLVKERSAVRLCLPADVSAALGTSRLLPAVVTINGHDVQTTLHKMGGGYMMVINAELRRRLGVDVGDTVRVSVEPNIAPRTVEVPLDLAEALDVARCRPAFEMLTSFRQAEMVKSVTGAKQPQTRARRIARVVNDLSGG